MNKRTEMRGTLARLRISDPMITTSATQRRKKMRNLQKAGCRLLHSFSHDEKRREDVFCVSASSRSSYDYDRSVNEEGDEEEGLFETNDGADRRWKRVLLHHLEDDEENAQRSRISTSKSTHPRRARKAPRSIKSTPNSCGSSGKGGGWGKVFRLETETTRG